MARHKRWLVTRRDRWLVLPERVQKLQLQSQIPASQKNLPANLIQALTSGSPARLIVPGLNEAMARLAHSWSRLGTLPAVAAEGPTAGWLLERPSTPTAVGAIIDPCLAPNSDTGGSHLSRMNPIASAHSTCKGTGASELTPTIPHTILCAHSASHPAITSDPLLTHLERLGEASRLHRP